MSPFVICALLLLKVSNVACCFSFALHTRTHFPTAHFFCHIIPQFIDHKNPFQTHFSTPVGGASSVSSLFCNLAHRLCISTDINDMFYAQIIASMSFDNMVFEGDQCEEKAPAFTRADNQPALGLCGPVSTCLLE